MRPYSIQAAAQGSRPSVLPAKDYRPDSTTRRGSNVLVPSLDVLHDQHMHSEPLAESTQPSYTKLCSRSRSKTYRIGCLISLLGCVGSCAYGNGRVLTGFGGILLIFLQYFRLLQQMRTGPQRRTEPDEDVYAVQKRARIVQRFKYVCRDVCSMANAQMMPSLQPRSSQQGTISVTWLFIAGR
jgi:hypothetical protein